MTSRRLHLRGRPNHPEDDPRPLKVMRARTLISSRTLARVISGPWMPRKPAGTEDPRLFRQQANWCYQLAWQCFDLAVAHELNLMGNKLTAKARALWLQERKARQTQKLVDPRNDDKVTTH